MDPNQQHTFFVKHLHYILFTQLNRVNCLHKQTFLGCADASHTLLGSGEGLIVAGIPLLIICCLQQNCGLEVCRLMTCLKQ